MSFRALVLVVLSALSLSTFAFADDSGVWGYDSEYYTLDGVAVDLESGIVVTTGAGCRAGEVRKFGKCCRPVSNGFICRGKDKCRISHGKKICPK